MLKSIISSRTHSGQNSWYIDIREVPSYNATNDQAKEITGACLICFGVPIQLDFHELSFHE